GHNPESPVPIRTRNAPAEAVTLPRGRRGSTLAASVLRFDLALLRTAFAEAGRLADPVAKIVQLRPANTSVPLDDDIGDLGGVHREGPLDSFAGHNAANRERLPGSAAPHCDHDAGEDLDPLLVAFQNPCMHIDGVA